MSSLYEYLPKVGSHFTYIENMILHRCLDNIYACDLSVSLFNSGLNNILDDLAGLKYTQVGLK